MAERVKRRVAAARLAVAFVAAGTIAGAAWAQAGPPPKAHSSASDIFAKLGDIKINSTNVVDGSLRLQDFHRGEVAGFDSFFKYKKASNKTLGKFKSQLGDIKTDVSTIKGELGGYIKTTEADARFWKTSQNVVLGDGSVFTATKAIDKAAQSTTLADLPGLIKVEATDQEFNVTNQSSGPLTNTSCAGGIPGTLAPGDSLSCGNGGGEAQTVQLVNGDGRVVTLNFSNVALPSGSQATVQILVGL